MDQLDVRTLRRSLLAAQPVSLVDQTTVNWFDDLKLFAAAVLGGMVFFSTFIG